MRRCENGSPPCTWYSGPRPCVPLLPDVPGLYGAQSESHAVARFLPQAQNGVRLPCRHFPVPLQKSCHARSCERNRWQHGLCVLPGRAFSAAFALPASPGPVPVFRLGTPCGALPPQPVPAGSFCGTWTSGHFVPKCRKPPARAVPRQGRGRSATKPPPWSYSFFVSFFISSGRVVSRS